MSVHVDIRGEGPDLILLHGWAMHGGVWGSFVERLAGFARVHVVDLPGHGYSAPVAPYTLSALADAVAEHVPDDAVWTGWSLGGAVATQAVLNHRTHARGLALIASSPCFRQRDDWPHAMPAKVLGQFAAQLDIDTPGTVQRFLALQAMGSPTARAQVQDLRAALMARPQPTSETLHRGLDLLDQVDLRADLPTLRLPIELIYGDRDTLVPIAAAQWLADVLPHAQLTRFTQSAHAPFLTHPDEVAARLKALLHA